MILASNPDRAVTVRERDPTYPGNDVPGKPRGALVDEVNGDSICDQIPLPHGHGSVNFRFSMIPSSLKSQVSGAPSRAAPFEKETLATNKGQRRLIRPSKFACSIFCGLVLVLLRVAQGLAMRSELPWVEVPLPAYAESVVAKTFPVGNNPFRGTGWLEQP